MARPLRVEFPGALYFVTARALPRQKLFRNAAEADDFLERLPALVENFGVAFHGFCLLPGHYHLLVETPRGGLSRALHRLNAGYTATINAGRKRKGPLLQSRYRALLIEEDPWLLRLSLHLHLNPVRKKLVDRPEEYRWSSARFFEPGREGFPGLETRRALDLAGGADAYRAALLEGVNSPPTPPWKDVWRQSVLGGEALRRKVREVAEAKNTRELPGFAARDPGQVGLDDVVRAVAEYTGIPTENLFLGKYQRVLARKVALYLARRFTSLTLREIGEPFGVDYTTVHMAARRVEELREQDPAVGELVRELEQTIQGVATEPEPAPLKRKAKSPRRKKKTGDEEDSPQLKLF